MTDQPETHLDCGDSLDDVREVVEMLSRSDGVASLWHDLEHGAGLFRLLAHLDLPSEGTVPK
ncbi:hypothetical protein [Micromonospora sp. KC723]|uniref:hypothetical protein n=1 Tax=Micromonospora sp. KC723 TaxID=2530381 RepID=UPI001FB7B0F2|nr:hypothetical protein [Micromonospora sp. KC723]